MTSDDGGFFRKLNDADFTNRLNIAGSEQEKNEILEMNRMTYMYRYVLDHALHSMTDPMHIEEREEMFEWLDPDSEESDFKTVCSFAGLHYKKVYEMFILVLEKYFPDVLKERACYWNSKVVQYMNSP